MEHAPLPRRGEPRASYWNIGCAAANTALAGLIRASLRDVRARAVVQLASDAAAHVFLPTQGWLVAAKLDPDGARQIVDFVLPGQAFDPASASAAIAATDVVALGHVRLATIPRDAWQRYLIAHPPASALFARQAAAGYARMAERMLRLGKSSAQTRLAHAICELCLRTDPFGLVPGRTFHLPVTQHVLGEFVGLSAVHVNRTIRAMTQAGVLDYHGQLEIVIHDMTALAAMAQIDIAEFKAAIIPASFCGG